MYALELLELTYHCSAHCGINCAIIVIIMHLHNLFDGGLSDYDNIDISSTKNCTGTSP